jgi:hypoxanthine phosphoribosyltransferase
MQVKRAPGVKSRFSRRQIAGRIARLGKTIRKDAGKGSAIFLIGILNGTAVFLSDLLRAIPGEVGYSFIDVIRDMSDTEIAEAMQIDFLSHVDIKDRNVYVIKDVVSTGVIETWLLGQLRQHGPASLKLVALLDRADLRTVDLRVDYALFEAHGADYVGYGLERGGRFGNLPFIGTIGR